MFHAFKFPWPAAVASLFDVASLSTASIDLAAPQCTINLSYPAKWIATQVLPVFLVSVLVLGIGASVALRSCQTVVALWRRRVVAAAALGARWSVARLVSSVLATFVNGIAEATDVLVGAIFTILYFTFFITVSRSLEVFKCTRDANAGSWTLDAEPGLNCWDGTVQASLVPFASLTLVLYGAGVPLLFAYVFKRHGTAIQRDQRRWLVGLGDSAESNGDYAIRRRYARLYQDFSPRYVTRCDRSTVGGACVCVCVCVCL
jgi:hypothetical protein